MSKSSWRKTHQVQEIYDSCCIYSVRVCVCAWGGGISISSLAKYLAYFRYLHLPYCSYITCDDVFWYNDGYAYDKKKKKKKVPESKKRNWNDQYLGIFSFQCYTLRDWRSELFWKLICSFLYNRWLLKLNLSATWRTGAKCNARTVCLVKYLDDLLASSIFWVESNWKFIERPNSSNRFWEELTIWRSFARSGFWNNEILRKSFQRKHNSKTEHTSNGNKICSHPFVYILISCIF